MSTSHEVWPEAREYERTALAVVDAYVQPKVRSYLGGFATALSQRGVPAVPHVTKSNGGIMPVAAARQQTVATLLSGPASGVIGAAYVAGAAGLDDLITLDVGGTSADIAVVEKGRPRSSTSEHIGGIPVMMPVIGVTAIGAGGGSVAWVDEVGVPKVGPQSTGARPGPACYGRGGTEATLTDAFVVSGFLDPERFLGGRMPLSRTLAEEAVQRYADTLGMGLHEAAESVVRVAVSNMYAAFTRILSRAGIDPRDFALVAFGGAGPLVGSLLAREVGIPTVFVPRAPGTLCALGAITADVLNDAVRTVHQPARRARCGRPRGRAAYARGRARSLGHAARGRPRRRQLPPCGGHALRGPVLRDRGRASIPAGSATARHRRSSTPSTARTSASSDTPIRARPWR